jgi:hypothetical protein
MRKAVAVIILVIAIAGVVVYTTHQGTLIPERPSTADDTQFDTITNAADSERIPTALDIRTNAQHPVFVERVLPVVREFFDTLDRAAVNPIQDDLPFNTVQLRDGPNGLMARFLIGDGWTCTAFIGPNVSGIVHFGERGPDNPFRAISHANTNALKRLSEKAIKMSQPEAERIIKHISDTFGIDLSRFEKPRIYPEKMFEYDLGMFTVAYRKKGTDPVNQLNYPISFSIRAMSPTTAVLVMYSDSLQP